MDEQPGPCSVMCWKLSGVGRAYIHPTDAEIYPETSSTILQCLSDHCSIFFWRVEVWIAQNVRARWQRGRYQ